MKTNKIFSKLNIKNYNNELEKVLEEKLFSPDVKNLLLSMLYKIENAYKDYESVKIEVLQEKDFIEFMIKTIKEKCFDIEFISPSKNEKPQIDRKKGKILCYPNEKSLLASIWYIGEEDILISFQYEYVKESVKKMIAVGHNIGQVEVIRDFNGWSWDIVISEIENMQYNILYQSILLLDGKRLLYANIGNESKNNILTQKNKQEFEDFIEIVFRTALRLDSQNNEKITNEVTNIKEEKVKQLVLFQNKKEFVQKVTDDKREVLSQIERIDRLLNNKELLKQEYQERNSMLPNKEKIFSISHLADRLEKEREQLLKQIKKYNEMIDPKQFVKAKEKIQDEVNFLTRQSDLTECCKAFLQCAKIQIEKTEEIEEIIRWMYKIRYYRYIPFDKNRYLKDVKELENDFKEVIKALIKKAQNNKIWDIFTENEELSYIVIRELFNSKMINFKNVNMVCTYEKGVLHIEYYDGNTLETKSDIKLPNVRIKKKIKLFI